MSTKDFTIKLTVDQTSEEVFNAINNVPGWWSKETEGSTSKVNDVFIHRYKDIHCCTIKVIESVPAKKVAWIVMDNYFSFTEDKTEWKDAKIIFEITKQGNKTELHFTHEGLTPAYECYDVCSDGWSSLINRSLRSLINTGKGQPE